jgi:hypothetical protein
VESGKIHQVNLDATYYARGESANNLYKKYFEEIFACFSIFLILAQSKLESFLRAIRIITNKYVLAQPRLSLLKKDKKYRNDLLSVHISGRINC